LNAVDIKVNKAGTAFNGTILAPTGSVEYHNPATFNGRIIAQSIDLHSDFNIAGPTVSAIPLPATLPLLLGALALFGLIRMRIGS